VTSAQPKEDSAKPGVDPVYAGDQVITGTGAPGAEIEVTLPGGATVVVPVRPDGTWEAKAPDGVELKDNDIIKAVQTESGKNSSDPTETLVIGSKESQPPKVNPIDEDDGKITGEGKPGAEIEVTFPGGTEVVVPVKPDGTWEVDVPDNVDLKDGDVIEVVQTEPGKEPSDPVTEVVVGSGEGGQQVKENSAMPEVDPVYAGDNVITGTGEPGAEIEVTFPGGTGVVVPVMPDGTWEAKAPDSVELKDNDIIMVVQTEPGKNPSDPRETLVVGSKESQPPKVDPIDEDDDKITGEGKPGAEIEVTFPGGTEVVVPVKPDGTWEVDVPDNVELKDGDMIEVVQTEPGKEPSDPVTEVVVGSGEGGGQQVKEDSVKPGVDPVYAGDGAITGTGKPGAEIEVTFPGGTEVAVPVKPDGTWEAKVPPGVELKDNDVIKAVQTESGKNPSDPRETLVAGGRESQPPTVKPIDRNDKIITGEGKAGAEITVTFPGGTTVTVKVEPDGVWKAPVPDSVRLKDGDVIKVVQTEPGKAPSDPVMKIVTGGGNSGGGGIINGGGGHSGGGGNGGSSSSGSSSGSGGTITGGSSIVGGRTGTETTPIARTTAA
jgi:hypothetical protein